jgi:hypothetical protein
MDPVHTTNYFDTFIEVAEDCPVKQAEVPALKNGEKTVVFLLYELISAHPYQYTSDDVIFSVYAKKSGITSEKLPDERQRFFSKGQPCLRSSSLTKRYGWGVHSDKDGRVAIYPVGSGEYEALRHNSALKHLKGMRTKKTS